MNQAIWDSTSTSRKNLLWLHDTLPADTSEELKNFVRYAVKKAIFDQWADPKHFPEAAAEGFWKQWKADKEARAEENAPPVDAELLREIKIAAPVEWSSLLELLDAIVQRNLQPADWRGLDQLILNALKVSYWFHVNTGTWKKQHAGCPPTAEIHRSPNQRPTVAAPIDIMNFTMEME